MNTILRGGTVCRKSRGVSCFISHAWGGTELEKQQDDLFVARLEKHLDLAGIVTYYDARLDERGANGSIPRFMRNIGKVNYILTVFTPAFKDKYEQGTDVATEVDYVITNILNRQPKKLVPILFSGTKDTAIPDLLTSVKYYDFTNYPTYHEQFFKVLGHMLESRTAELTQLRNSLREQLHVAAETKLIFTPRMDTQPSSSAVPKSKSSSIVRPETKSSAYICIRFVNNSYRASYERSDTRNCKGV